VTPPPTPAPAAPPEVDSQSILDRVESLPTLPVIALRVGEMVHGGQAPASAIAALMRSDPSLSAKVLRLVNSPYFSIPGGVNDVQRAISFIGFNTLHQIVLSVTVLEALRTPAGSRFDARGLWLHSLAVGACAQVIATEIGHPDPGGCFTAGLMHDVGKICLAKTEPLRFGAALDDAHRSGASMAEAERRAGLPSHDRVGSRLARLWKFPATLLAPIELHHCPPDAEPRERLSPALRASIDIVALADRLCRHFGIGDGGSPPSEGHDLAALDRLGLGHTYTGRVHGQLMRKLEVSKVFLTLIDQSDVPSSSSSSSSPGVLSPATGTDTLKPTITSPSRR
jgi:HD-like signal output (HDOD) protein